MEPGENTVKAVRERRAVLTELDREPVRGVDAGSDTERILKGGVLGDKPDGAGPRWDHVHALGEREPDHRPDRVATAPRPAGSFEVGDQPYDLRAVEQRGDLRGATQRWYVPNGHRGCTLLVQTPGRWRVAGVTLYRSVLSTVAGGSDKTAGHRGCAPNFLARQTARRAGVCR